MTRKSVKEKYRDHLRKVQRDEALKKKLKKFDKKA